jgi:hypothetical protein
MKRFRRFLRDEPVAAMVVATLIVAGILAFLGVIPKGIDALSSALGGGPSTQERDVDALYRRIEDARGFWAAPPVMADASRAWLVQHWPDYSPYIQHRGSGPGTLVSIDELHNDQRLDGQPVFLDAFVGDPQVERATIAGASIELINLHTADDRTQAYCETTTATKFKTGDYVRAEGIAVARGEVRTEHPSLGTWLACRRVTVTRRAG